MLLYNLYREGNHKSMFDLSIGKQKKTITTPKEEQRRNFSDVLASEVNHKKALDSLTVDSVDKVEMIR